MMVLVQVDGHRYSSDRSNRVRVIIDDKHVLNPVVGIKPYH